MEIYKIIAPSNLVELLDSQFVEGLLGKAVVTEEQCQPHLLCC